MISRTPSDPDRLGDEGETIKKACKGTEDWVVKLSATVARARVELRKEQVRYKNNFDRRLRRGNPKINGAHYVFQDTQKEKGKKMIVGHTECPFLVLNLTTRTFFSPRDYLVERVNRDRVRWAATPNTTEALP